ncbi:MULTISPECIES: nuclease domain-containing protein [Cohnella]|uniref:nuclease domain-containing protein n=1 Tax=Cohnella TaxID=329857 RepID=UPI001F0863F1|nr:MULTISPECIES: nuclease domain-containing protein [Cohnella]
MHRYRDAIVYEDGNRGELERSMFGAYVLFPYHDEEKFREHKFYKSIELVNVGAFPFSPNSTKLMEAFLDEIIMTVPRKLTSDPLVLGEPLSITGTSSRGKTCSSVP